MILSSIKCNKCTNKQFDFFDEIKDDSIILQYVECNHFLINLSINIKKKMFEKYILSLKCKNCQDLHIQTFTGHLDNQYVYKCKNCEIGPILFSYKLDLKNKKNYQTPELVNKEISDKKINIKFVYQFAIYNLVVNSNDKIGDKYDELRAKINFPYGKKILFNNNEVDMDKSFDENKIIDGMKLLIQD